jgi:hypothetical protein
MTATTRPRARRRWRRLAAAVSVLLLVFAAFGCTSTITPPSHPERPTTVFLLREAMHNGLVLPPAAGESEYVEFGFGDWSWFALGNDAWYDVFATVLWPTQATLARRTFAARDEAELRARVAWAELSAVVVDGDRVRDLRARLQQQFDAGAARAVRRPELGWTFVPIDRSYWFANTCADVSAEWFVALDCSVGWAPIRASLAVAR